MDFETEKFYHLTTSENLPSIMENGLKRLIGENSKRAKEHTPAVYLCGKDDLPFWSVILNKDIVLEVDIDEFDEEFNYIDYHEYIVKRDIPASKVSISNIDFEVEYAQRLILEGVVFSLTDLSLEILRYNSEEENHTRNLKLRKAFESFFCFSNNIKLSHISDKIKEEMILDISSDGYYTFLDLFKESGRKIYEEFLNYKKEDNLLNGYLLKTYDYVQGNFSECLDLNTGMILNMEEIR